MRRQSIIGASLAVAVAMSLSACGGDSGGESNTVRVTLANHVWTENVKQALPAFEKETGLKVEITQLGEDQLSDQYNVKLNAGSPQGRDDVPPFAGGEAEQVPDGPERWRPTRTGTSVTPSPARRLATTNEGKPRRPIITEQESSLPQGPAPEGRPERPAKTLDELKAAATKMKEAEPGVAGRRPPASRPRYPIIQLPLQLRRRLRRQRRQGHDQRTRPSRRTPIRRADQAQRPGEHQHRHGLARGDAIFTQGQAAFYTEANSLYKNATNPPSPRSPTRSASRGSRRAPPGRSLQHPVVGAGDQRQLGEQG